MARPVRLADLWVIEPRASTSTTLYDKVPTMSQDAQVITMYIQLLEAVLAYEADPDTELRSQGPLADVVRLRRVLERRAGRSDPGWALQAVADQLAYDAALVRLARRRGIAAGPHDFDVPERGRAGLEAALIAAGVNLPSQDEPVTGSVD